MRNFTRKILLAVAAFAVGVGYTYAPMVVSAEETGEAVDLPVETSEAVQEESVEDVETSSPEIKETDSKQEEMTSETEESATVSEDSAEAPENSVETPTTDDNANVEEIPDTEEKDENSVDLQHTFESFLAWTEQEAERYGYGDQYTAALEAIKTAATQKQVTLSTIGSFALALVIVAYIVYKKVTDKKFKDNVSSLSTSLNAQFEKLKELVDGTNSNTKTEEEIKAEEQALKEEMQKTKNALENLINGFMHFSSHVNMKDEHKTEVQRDCAKALKSIDGEVEADEDHKE